MPIDLFDGVQVEVKTLVAPEGAELPSDEELERWRQPSAGAGSCCARRGATVQYEYVDETRPSGSLGMPPCRVRPLPRTTRRGADEPDGRADAEAALNDPTPRVHQIAG